VQHLQKEKYETPTLAALELAWPVASVLIMCVTASLSVVGSLSAVSRLHGFVLTTGCFQAGYLNCFLTTNMGPYSKCAVNNYGILS